MADSNGDVFWITIDCLKRVWLGYCAIYIYFASYNRICPHHCSIYYNLEICRFSTETFWRLVFSHEWFIINLQRDEVELEMNSEPRV